MMATSMTPSNVAKRRTRLENTLARLGWTEQLAEYKTLVGKARIRMAAELNRQIQARRNK
jgi:hypothetical protein